MPQTKLIEFPNKTNDLLRGILLSNGDSARAVLMCENIDKIPSSAKFFA